MSYSLATDGGLAVGSNASSQRKTERGKGKLGKRKEQAAETIRKKGREKHDVMQGMWHY